MQAHFTKSAIFSCLLALTNAFYIPGVSYKSYRDGETIPLFVNKVYSDKSELQYKYTELPFVCPPTGRVRTGRFTSGASISLNLGEVLRGDRITVSDYELVMGADEEARYLCSHTLDSAGLRRTRELIKDGYVAEWIVDNLPGATSFQTTDKSRKYYAAGFKIGEVMEKAEVEPRYFLNNHVTLVIRYHGAPGRDGEQGKKVIVGFEVFPKSIEARHRGEDGLPEDISHVANGMELIAASNSTGQPDEDDAATLTIPFTYSVYFREAEGLEWKNRWDMYFVAQDDSSNIHWLAIINALVITGLLTAAVAVIITRTVYGDIKAGIEDTKVRPKRGRRPRSPKKSVEKSSGLLDQLGDVEGDADISSDEEFLDDATGWKLLHGDVFRAPPYGGLLAPLVGSGTQLIFMAAGLLILGSFGVLNPSFRGGYISVGTGLFVFAGLFSGYFSSRIFKTFGGRLWQKNVLVTASLVPGLIFATTFFLNLFVWIRASSNAIPFTTLLALIALWLFIQLPLVYVGGWYGFERAGAVEQPLKVNAIPRQIPQHSWYKRSAQIILLAGLVPFVVIFVELMFVLRSLWLDKSGYYYVFGFLGVSSLILCVAVVEVTIVGVYVLLCLENHHWPWHSFLIGSSSSLWIAAYLTYYFFNNLHISGVLSTLLFFSYGLLATAVYGLLTGTIGFLAAAVFVRRIYGAVKVD